MMGGYGGKGPLIMGVTWTEFFVSCLMVAARCYTNQYITGETGWDFWWSVATILKFFGFVSQCFLAAACHFGLGNESASLDHVDSSNALLYSWIAQSIAIFSIALSKFVVISFLLRVQGRTGSWGRYLLWFLAFTNFILNLFETFLVMFQCEPTSKLWEPNTPGHCYVRDHVNTISGYMQGGWNAASDVILAVYPAFLFSSVDMPLRLKIGVSCLMATGLAAAACAAAKTWEIQQTHVTDDVTQALVALIILNWSELWVTLIAASIPAIWPLVGYVKRGGRDKYERQQDPSSLGDSHGSIHYSLTGDETRSESPSHEFGYGDRFAIGYKKGSADIQLEPRDGDSPRNANFLPFHANATPSLDYQVRPRTPSIRNYSSRSQSHTSRDISPVQTESGNAV